jgi:uncharacterized protein (DUF488 family)
MTQGTIYTIGHSTHSMERFLDLLAMHRITAVADVRSQPHSRQNPQFNREALTRSLREVGAAYVFLGRELGARTEDPACYAGGKVQYDRLARSPLFQEGLRRVIEGTKNHRIVLMCAEHDPLGCHRCILIARELERSGIEVVHILRSGALETQAAALERLTSELGLNETTLFQSRQQSIEEAYRIRGERIAYSRRDNAASRTSRAGAGR